MSHSYSVVDKKFGQQKSDLDTHDYDPSQFSQPAQTLTPEKTIRPNLNVRDSMALNLRDQSSNLLGGENTLHKYANIDPN
jgi:hypothetical protein